MSLACEDAIVILVVVTLTFSGTYLCLYMYTSHLIFTKAMRYETLMSPILQMQKLRI